MKGSLTDIEFNDFIFRNQIFDKGFALLKSDGTVGKYYIHDI